MQIKIKTMLESGMHLGHDSKDWNPKMKKFIVPPTTVPIFSGRHVIDLVQTYEQMRDCRKSVQKKLCSEVGIIVVGTSRQSFQSVFELGKRIKISYVDEKWMRGMLTNWSTISRAVRGMKIIKSESVENRSGKGKKEALCRKRIIRAHRYLGGVREEDVPPEISVIIDINNDAVAMIECKKLSIKVLGTLDTDCDPEIVTMSVAMNDDSSTRIDLLLRTIFYDFPSPPLFKSNGPEN